MRLQTSAVCVESPVLMSGGAVEPLADLQPIVTGQNRSNGRWKYIAKMAKTRLCRRSPGAAITVDKQLDNNEQNSDKDLTLLQIFALHTLDLTAPASDVLLRKNSDTNDWIQVSGHNGAFAVASPGIIWKKCGDDGVEIAAYRKLMTDKCLRSFVPKFYGEFRFKSDTYIEIQDLLHEFNEPCMMDVKLGTRTFLESEVRNFKLRNDLYAKMVKLDKNAPTDEENALQAVTKLRYMKFREDLSSSSNLGFRIEGFKTRDENGTKYCNYIKHRDEIRTIFDQFLPVNKTHRHSLVDRLKKLRQSFNLSEFFKRHEIIGSSLLIIYDDKKIGVWMIDFGKTVQLDDNCHVDHISKWALGNHEDGYLFGLNNLIQILEDL